MTKRAGLSKKDWCLGFVSLLVGIAGLLAWIALVFNGVIWQSQAAPSPVPSQVKLTNLSENSLTVSWVTDTPTTGSVVYSLSESFGSSSVAYDDRDGSIISLLHHVTLRNLKPAVNYYFRLQSGEKIFDNNNKPYIFTTPGHSSLTPPPPFLIKGKAEKESLVYFSFNESEPISTVADTQGNFLLILSNSLGKDHTGRYPVQKGEKGYLVISDSQSVQTREIIVEDQMTVFGANKGANAKENPTSLESTLPAPAERSKPNSLWGIINNLFQGLRRLFISN